jgi:hypothetical protein
MAKLSTPTRRLLRLVTKMSAQQWQRYDDLCREEDLPHGAAGIPDRIRIAERVLYDARKGQ